MIVVIFIFTFAVVLGGASIVISSSGASEGPDMTTGNQSRGFDDIVDAHGKVQAISETAVSWEECMDGAHDRIWLYRDYTSITAQMEWDIAVCDRMFPAGETAELDLAVPGAFP